MKNIKNILIILMFIVGVLILSYPVVSNWLATRKAVTQVENYEAKTVALSKDEREEYWAEAVNYNDHLKGDPVRDPFVPSSGWALPENYLQVLDFDDIMCYIEIPTIDVMLPVYHGVEEEVLQKGVGHIESTAFPIGGIGNHPVLTGHTGLPSAKLFTDLRDLEIGDTFNIHILGKALFYEVDQIKVIDPDNISDLMAEDDKDYVTLLTCTPYGINSHRLLVRGVRSDHISRIVHMTVENRLLYKVLMIVALVFTLMLFISLVVVLVRGRKRLSVLKMAVISETVKEKSEFTKKS